MRSTPRKAKLAEERPAGSKRAKLPRRSDHSADFIKAWKRFDRDGRVDLNEVKTVMGLIIANDGALPAEYRDHELKGSWAGYRECHIRNNHLLIYKLIEDDATVVFADMGTHAELFE